MTTRGSLAFVGAFTAYWLVALPLDSASTAGQQLLLSATAWLFLAVALLWQTPSIRVQVITLVCVATNVPFEPGSLRRIAIEAHDGLARAVRPAHTIVDGDVAFALAPGGAAPDLLTRLRVGAAAAEAVARAIVAAVL